MIVLSHKQLILLAYSVASETPHPSTQVGAFLYLPQSGGGIPFLQTSGSNTMPKGLTDSLERWEDPLARSQYVEHAERSVIYSAARQGICTDRVGMVATWAACTDCARAIIAAGIAEVLTDGRSFKRTAPEWVETVLQGRSMMAEAGVNVIDYDGPLIGELRQGRQEFTL